MQQLLETIATQNNLTMNELGVLMVVMFAVGVTTTVIQKRRNSQ